MAIHGSDIPREGSYHSAEITDLALPNDYGVCKVGGYVVFVPGAVPLDSITLQMVRRGNNFGYGQICSVDKPSPFRIDPSCPHFGMCGGCTLQNISYSHQLVIKDNYLRQTLQRVGHIDINKIDMAPITASPQQFLYRGKVELAFGSSEGKTVLGLRKRLSPFEKFNATVVPLNVCPVFSPVLKNILHLFNEYARTHNLKPYDPLSGRGFLRHLIIRESKTTGELMVILETTTGNTPGLALVWQELSRLLPQVKGLHHAINNNKSDVIHLENVTCIKGSRFITEKQGPFVFRIRPDSFFQPNPQAARVLLDTIPSLISLTGTERVLGLYCGTGTIEIALSRFVKKVIGVDSLQANIDDAIDNCRTNFLSNCSFHKGIAENLFQNISLFRPDILVLDPPRGGLSEKTLNNILKLDPGLIIYISCNPSTLARDIKNFIKFGHILKYIRMFDFFPHTSHLETLAIIE